MNESLIRSRTALALARADSDYHDGRQMFTIFIAPYLSVIVPLITCICMLVLSFTLCARIPPNSTLIFEVELLSAE